MQIRETAVSTKKFCICNYVFSFKSFVWESTIFFSKLMKNLTRLDDITVSLNNSSKSLTVDANLGWLNSTKTHLDVYLQIATKTHTDNNNYKYSV